MRRVSLALALVSALLLPSCGSGGGGDQSPLVPAALPGAGDGPAVALSPSAALGGFAMAAADLGESALGLYTVTINPAALTGSAQPLELRSGQANDDLYLLSVGNFLKINSFRIVGVKGKPGAIDLIWEFEHPFPAPSTPGGAPNGSTNRADLGIAGMVMPLIDVPTATGNTYFTDRVANTTFFSNSDAYFSPAGMLTLSGNIANTFPYQTLVDETGTDGSRVGVSNGGSVTGNFGTDGWTRSEMGGGAPFNKWTGYGVLHQGQTSRRALSMPLAGGVSGTTQRMTVAVIAKYNDPRMGANAAAKRAHRLPPASPDMAIFGYRMPHGALDAESIKFEGATGTGFITNTVSASTLRFHVVDWDARGTVTTATDLSLDPDPTTIRTTEFGPPDLAVCIPGVLGGSTVLDDWNPGSDILNDDSAVGGDAALDSGRPGDALFYSKSVTKLTTSGQTDGFYTGMVRATDPDQATGIDGIIPLDESNPPRPLTSNLPQPVTYQAFTVMMTSVSGAPIIALTTPANVVSGNTTTVTVTGAFDAGGQTITVNLDWDNDTIWDDIRTILPPYAVPADDLPPRLGSLPYDEYRDIRFRPPATRSSRFTPCSRGRA
ncbi:MAG: hypothetical protein ABI743_13595 [bacterium]